MILTAFLLSAIYWFYLLISSQIIIVYDAVEYESLGRLLCDHGFREFFITGPHREPLYPLLISLAMKISHYSGLRWDSILKIMQCLCLLNTQILLCWVLKKLKINRVLIAFFVLYIGISPSLVNATFSLFSEIASIFWPLAIVALSALTWSNADTLKRGQCLGLAIATAFLFICLTFVKAIFEPVSFIFMSIFWFRLIQAGIKKNTVLFNNLLCFILSFSFIYYGAINSYKLVNKFTNHEFTMTTRGPVIFYSNAQKRAQSIDWKKFPAYALTIPGNEFCVSAFDSASCDYWGFRNIDLIAEKKVNELGHQGFQKEGLNQQLFKSGLERIQEHPFSYMFFTLLEGSKFLFWESTHIGFVLYPQWLQNIFDTLWLANGLTLFIGGLMLLAVFFALRQIYRHRREKPNEESAIILFCLWMTFACIVPLSMTLILKRYFLTLAALFLILIAYCIDKTLKYLCHKK